MSSDPRKIALFPNDGERAPETREEEAQALVDYFRHVTQVSQDPNWRLGLYVSTTWQRCLAEPGRTQDVLRLLFILNCSRNLGSVWFFMNLMLNRWGHKELLQAGRFANSTALWAGVQQALSTHEAYCLSCCSFYDRTPMDTGCEPPASCPKCDRLTSINLTLRTPQLCPKCFESRAADVRACAVCQSELADVFARNRVESWAE